MSSVQDKAAFAYQVNNNLLQPVFDADTTLIISPERKYHHESFILVKKDNAVYIRQVRILENQKVLLLIPSIPSLIEAMDESITVIGTVIESYRQHVSH
jgi:phage repressor protein C with HTH and peptisase S24 domain